MTRPNPRAEPVDKANRRLLRKLLLVTVAMFGFGFALVPLYSVFCQITGLNGKTERIDEQTAQGLAVDDKRWVTVEFTASVNNGMPWEFRPATTSMRVHPGEVNKVAFYARNPTNEDIVGQAVPSVTPGQAAAHFKKLECFCFSRQTLKAGEAKDMPVRFIVDSKLAPEVRTVTLSYTFFNVDAASAKKYGGSQPSYSPSGEHEHEHAAEKAGA